MHQTNTTSNDVSQVLNSLGFVPVSLGQNMAGQLLIHANVNDVPGKYILDTGAGTSVIDKKQAELLKLHLRHDEVDNTGGGIGAHQLENIPCHNNSIDIGSIRLDTISVAVMTLTSAWESLASIGAHDELFGFLGMDILKAGNGIIDLV